MKRLLPAIFLALVASAAADSALVEASPDIDTPIAQPSTSEPISLDTLAAGVDMGDGLVSSITLSKPGDVVTSFSDLYRRAPAERIAIDDQPLSAVLKGLAKESQISFDLSDDLPKRTVTVYYTLPPFTALEKLAQRYGAELIEEDGIFQIRKMQPDALVMEIYRLNNITLGSSSSASGSQTFGTGFSGVSSGSGDSGNGNSSSGYGSSNGTSGFGNGSSNGMMNNGSSGGLNGSMNSSSSMQAPRQMGSNILVNLRGLLALQSTNAMETADGSTQSTAAAGQTQPANGATASTVTFRGSIDYAAASNTLTIVATRDQHKWVKQYLKAVDVPMSQIGLDVLFVESDVNPSESFGVDWSKSLQKGFELSAGEAVKGLSWGTTSLPALPTGVAISSQQVQAALHAWVSSKMARISQRPTIVTKPDQDVSFETIKEIPTIGNASTTSAAGSTRTDAETGTVPGQGNSSTLQTSFASDVQKIGTTLRLRAVPIRKDLLSVTVSIEISSPDSSGTGGELLTGRIATTSTSYQGVFDVEVGKTLAIGGLERVVEETGISKIPGLGSIPFFGYAFKHRAKSLAKTHLTIFVTPSMIESAMDATGTAATSHESSRRLLEATRGMQQRSIAAEQKLENN